MTDYIKKKEMIFYAWWSCFYRRSVTVLRNSEHFRSEFFRANGSGIRYAKQIYLSSAFNE